MTGTALQENPPLPSPEPGLSVDALVDATPDSRDRVVDLLRAASIAVVVLWHWTFSITQWRHGALRMPNPIADVPGLWAATWLLQVMPLFFLVGGYSNLAGWSGVVRGGGGGREFLARRFSRLVRPVAVYVACWTLIDLAWRASGGRSVLDWGMVVFVPLWFLGVYVGVVTLVPLTARLHERYRWATLLTLAGGIGLADTLRLGVGISESALGLIGSTLVWVFAHQLGYLWRDWTSTSVSGAVALPDRVTRRRGLGLLGLGLAALALLTTVGPYSESMVAVRGDDVSNMFPTTACIAALAMLQLGVVLAVRPSLTRWLRRRSVWRTIVAANAVAMTVFCWHMTALVVFLLAYEAAGFTLATDPTAAWWLTRPVWIVGPAVVLAGLLALFARFELPGGSGGTGGTGGSGRRRSAAR